MPAKLVGKLCGKPISRGSDSKCCLYARHIGLHQEFVYCQQGNCDNFVGNKHCTFCGLGGLCSEHMKIHQTECVVMVMNAIAAVSGHKIRKTKKTAKKKAKPKKKIPIEPLGYVVPDHFEFDREA